MRRILLAASLLLALSAMPVAAADAPAMPEADVDADAVTNAVWFRMWCWDEELIYTTPGFWVGGCRDHIVNDVIPCFVNGGWCPPGGPGGDSALCVGGRPTVGDVRACLYDLFVQGGPPGGVRMVCLDRQFEDNTVQGVVWRCVDYQVFEKVVCVEVRC